MENHEKYLVVYPRGFIGFAAPGLNVETNDKTLIEKVIDLRYNEAKKKDEVKEVYNANVAKIYKTLIEGVVTRDKLTFNKAIIVEALRNFGNLDLSDWFNIQKKSRYFTKNHQDFIIDTLKFIRTGRRDTNLRTWEMVLKKRLIEDSESVSNNKNFNKEISSFFEALASDGKPINNNLTRVLAEWLSHRNGNEDLAITLNLLFGRPY